MHFVLSFSFTGLTCPLRQRLISRCNNLNPKFTLKLLTYDFQLVCIHLSVIIQQHALDFISMLNSIWKLMQGRTVGFSSFSSTTLSLWICLNLQTVYLQYFCFNSIDSSGHAASISNLFFTVMNLEHKQGENPYSEFICGLSTNCKTILWERELFNINAQQHHWMLTKPDHVTLSFVFAHISITISLTQF